MRILYSFLLVLITVISLRAQKTPHAFWESQHPLPQGNNLAGVKMFDSANYIMCGDIGTVVSTSDDGTTWKVQTRIAGVTKSLNGIDFADRLHGVTVGGSGAVLITSDGGMTWAKELSNVVVALNSVTFVTPSIVFAVGQSGTIIKSVDTGKTWVPVAIETAEHFRCVTFITKDSGYITATNGLIFSTTDGGTAWKANTYSFNNSFFGISFHSNHKDVALAGELGGLFLSHDGGSSYTKQAVAPYGNVNAVAQITPTTCIVACDFHAILVTTNSGSSWKNVLPFGGDHLKAISFIDDKQGVVVGNNGIILRTYDGGNNWEAVFNRVTIDKSALKGVWAIDDYTVVACGTSGLIVKSINGGKTWRAIQSGTFQQLNAVHFSTPNVGTIVGDSGYVLRTQDGGESWYKIPTPHTKVLKAVSFLDTTNGIIVGESGTILLTRSGGRGWYKITYIDTAYLTSVSFNTASQIVIGGHWNTSFIDITTLPILMTSTDGGFNFKEIPPAEIPSVTGINALSFPTPRVGYAVGWLSTTHFPRGRVLKTIDSGMTWSQVGDFDGRILDGVSFPRPNFGTVVGDLGRTFHTRDGGVNWDTVESTTGLNLYAVSHSSLGFAWAVGVKTIIIRETTDDVDNSGVSTQTPVSRTAEMLTNYPNPTREATTFSIRLPKASDVALHIYSASGVEIESVYNGFFPEGEHTIGWSAQHLPAGIYFAILDACGKREMIKVVVEK